MTEKRYNVFISHASEDKLFVRPLAEKLKTLGVKVWYDETSINPGDSLRREIDKGLSSSDFGVLILSKHFFKKEWALAELNAFIALKQEGKSRLIPIWHEISKEEITDASPILSDLLAIETSEGIDSVAVKILRAVRPEVVEIISKTVSASSKTSYRGASRTSKYQIELGKRHRHLREKILEINPRRMADFYGFEKVAHLEACECGDDEFPGAALDKLRSFFFINRQYLEEGSKAVFDVFDNVVSSEATSILLGQGFEVYLLCRQEDRENLWCHPMLHKAEGGLSRVVCAYSFGYFASSGGGKTNLVHIIKAMHANNLSPWDACALRVNSKSWERLQNRTYYQKDYFGDCGPDDEAQDLFEKWFEEAVPSYRIEN